MGKGTLPELLSRQGLGGRTPRGAGSILKGRTLSDPDCLRASWDGEGVEESLRVWVGPRDWDSVPPPPAACSLRLQLFLCCLLNLQESGLLCEVRYWEVTG